MAASIRMPVALPSAPRSILPPDGSAVSSVMPAAARTAELATRAWPSERPRMTLWLPLTGSRSDAIGMRPSGQPVSIQPRPTRTEPSGLPSSSASTRVTSSATEAVPSRLSVSSRSPTPRRWTWASVKPGNMTAPSRSIRLISSSLQSADIGGMVAMMRPSSPTTTPVTVCAAPAASVSPV